MKKVGITGGAGFIGSNLSERLVSSGITCHSLESVVSNFKGWNLPLSNVEFVKGWFQNTIEEYYYIQSYLYNITV